MNIIGYEADNSVNMNMSSLQGYVMTTYDKLVEVFGKPTYTDADPYEKVNAEWNVEVETDKGDFIKFSVYNWKDGFVPTGEYNWHIGGYDYVAVEIAEAIINGDS